MEINRNVLALTLALLVAVPAGIILLVFVGRTAPAPVAAPIGAAPISVPFGQPQAPPIVPFTQTPRVATAVVPGVQATPTPVDAARALVGSTTLKSEADLPPVVATSIARGENLEGFLNDPRTSAAERATAIAFVEDVRRGLTPAPAPPAASTPAAAVTAPAPTTPPPTSTALPSATALRRPSRRRRPVRPRRRCRKAAPPGSASASSRPASR